MANNRADEIEKKESSSSLEYEEYPILPIMNIMRSEIGYKDIAVGTAVEIFKNDRLDGGNVGYTIL